MKTFEFSTTVVNRVLEELEKAEEFIKIAVFQIHLEDLFKLLVRKISQGVKIEIFTLPYDSIHDSVRPDVTEHIKNLSNLGVKIYFCKWNVGDPERTTMAIGKWYSFHGKFIVTDKTAIALSANFTRSSELDAAIIIRGEEIFIKNFVDQFNKLLKLFVNEHEGFEGQIRRTIINLGLSDIESVFELPSVIQTETHQNTWIRHYPGSLCPINIEIDEKLYIAPFSIRGRNIYEKILHDAEDFIFVSAESFTDVEFGLFLRQLKIEKKIDIILLTGFTSMDFSDRIQKMYRELIADEIKLYTIEENLHAKFIITDKHLLIGSINLNKMNLGFNKTKKYWRENTETFFVSLDHSLIKEAKAKFKRQISNSVKMENKLAEKIQNEVSVIFNKSFKVKARKEVKELFSKFVLMKEIEIKKDANKLVKITKRLMQHYNYSIANKDTFFMAIVLFYLQDRKHTFTEIENKINKLEDVTTLHELIIKLIDSEFIEVQEDFYKINIETLFQ